MPNEKISQLPDGGALADDDVLVVERVDGDSYSILGSEIGGGGGSLGVWKEYGIDSSNQPIDSITVGDGSLVGKWWTLGTVVPSEATDPFLCTIIANFRLGTTSTVDGGFGFALPRIVDGLSFNIAPAETFEANGFAEASGVGDYPGCAIGDGSIVGGDGTHWDATHPFVWAEGHNLMISVTFLARFAAD